MAAAQARTQAQVRKAIEAEREQLAGAVEHLRGELGEVANLTGKLKSNLPLAAGGAASIGFVLAGGVGATMRYLARRGRDGHEQARVGRFALRNHD
jgi:shikimate kinase